MRQALIFGGSGQIGRPLLQRLQRDGWEVTALSRQPQRDEAGVRWLRGDLATLPELPAQVDAIFSCGPLDAFARWHASPASVASARVIAFGSTSVTVKQASADAAERDLARRLHDAESTLFATAQSRGAAATLLRPTLVYGAGRDATLTRIASLARRFGWFPLPRGACGLRQPVHVDDLADAVMQAIDSTTSFGHAYALPGGETLPYREMVARVLDVLRPPPKLLEVPAPLFAIAAQAARITGRASSLGDAAVQRMRDDLVFDAVPAQRDLGYAPRAFTPDAAMFLPNSNPANL